MGGILTGIIAALSVMLVAGLIGGIRGVILQHKFNKVQGGIETNRLACRSCGKTVEKGNKFCTSCGAPVEIISKK